MSASAAARTINPVSLRPPTPALSSPGGAPASIESPPATSPATALKPDERRDDRDREHRDPTRRRGSVRDGAALRELGHEQQARPRRPARRRRTSRAGASGRRAAARPPARPRRGPSRAEPWRSSLGVGRPGTRHACQARRPRPAERHHPRDGRVDEPPDGEHRDRGDQQLALRRGGRTQPRDGAHGPIPAPAPARRSAATLMPAHATRASLPATQASSSARGQVLTTTDGSTHARRACVTAHEM